MVMMFRSGAAQSGAAQSKLHLSILWMDLHIGYFSLCRKYCQLQSSVGVLTYSLIQSLGPAAQLAFQPDDLSPSPSCLAAAQLPEIGRA